ncbi:MalY/PatB family protein [Leadbettera azotonutricia]|uniref:cysteine-S-conjugate beta-lyase n=1 Tax=Leadbettera azotonutricia (strain ATCC BAA-888 / DSM 13862 / ZAS-9) TaxID=545695 RepID=F5YAI3_LEAAZ|nr:PatB family C-S lyase [Leadbettera azotonutricia]AEF83222.1 aminotransferase [Leadbettera azotonutricia ZAS-9]
MNFDFDRIIDRHGTLATKWDDLDRGHDKAEPIPLWVADMDFPSPPEVTQALLNRAGHPVYGYSMIPVSYYETLVAWYKTQYQTELSRHDFILSRGVVPALGTAVNTWSKAGEGVLILTPIYPPFFEVIRRSGRVAVEAPMKLNDTGRYSFDSADLEKALANAENRGIHVSLMLFCSPHNPGGAVWHRAELESILAFAQKHGIVVAADEIHADFVYTPRSFCSLAAFPDHASRVVVISSANKTFNLGGLHASHFVVRDNALKVQLKRSLEAEWSGAPDIFSFAAAEAAYKHGAEWIFALKAYILRNIEITVKRIAAECPGLKAYKPEGTYLVWANASEHIAKLNLKDDVELVKHLEISGRVKATPGSIFGSEGRGFIRINAACPRSQLEKGLDRMAYFFSNKRDASSLT